MIQEESATFIPTIQNVLNVTQ